MRADDLDALLARVARGEPEALALLIAGTRGDLRVLVANHAVSTTMVDEVLTAAWEEAYPRLGSAPAGGFLSWFWDIARDLLARVLGEGDRAATEHGDPLAHAIARAGLDGLSAGFAEEVAGLATFKRGIEGLEPAMQLLVRRRYADRLRVEVLAAELGQPEATVSTTLFRARAAARGQLGPAEQLIGSDPLFPALVEDHVNGTLIPDGRQLLASSVVKDLEYCAAFESQVRADLILVAMFGPSALEAARELAAALMTPVRTSQRLRAQRGSDRQGRISDRPARVSDRAARVSDRISGGGTGRISDPRRRSTSGQQSAVSGTGSFRRGHDAPGEPAERGGGPWTIIGVAAVVLAVLVGFFALKSGGDDPRPRRHPDPVATAPTPTVAPTPTTPTTPTSPTTPRPTPPAPRSTDPVPVVVPRTPSPPVATLVPTAPIPVPAVPAVPVADGPPAVALTPPAALMAGTAVEIAVTATGAGIAGIEVLADGQKIGEAKAAPFTVTWTPSRAGGLRLQARATDASGRVGLSEIVLATVAPAPPPTLSVRMVPPAASFSAPASIPLVARVEGGMVERIEFLHGEAKLAEKLAPPYESTWNRVPPGSYEIRARAWGRDGSITSDPVTVVVTVPATQPPSARIESPTEFESIAENQKAMIRVRAVDKDGVIARVEFLVDGQKIGDDATLPYSWVWPKPTWGEHVLSAVAIDDRGSRGEAEPVAVLVGQKTITRFVRGISFGEAAEIDGYRLLALTDAARDGFNVGNGKVTTPRLPSAGELDASQRALFAHALATDEEQLRCSQALPDGFYAVYAWVADNGEPGTFDLELEGAKAGSLGKVPKGGWARAGPFNVRVADGCLNIAAIRRSGAPRLAGLAIYGVMVDQPPGESGMYHDWWVGIGGTEIGSLTAMPAYPSSPAGHQFTPIGEVGGFGPDTGSRASAWVVPPVSGVYRVFVRGDDQVEVDLSPDETPARAVRVAFCPGATDKWDAKPEQQSGDIPLVAGRRYFLRVLEKNGPQGGWLSVGWRFPDGTMERPIPGSRLTAVPIDGVSGLVAMAEARKSPSARARPVVEAATSETVANDGDTAAGPCQLAYDSAWMSDGKRPEAYRGDEHYAETANAVATVTFTGTRLQWFGSKAPNLGIAAVSFDGGPETMVDLYAATTQWNALQYASPALAAGRHVCRIRVTPQRNPASSGSWITVDRISVATSSAAAAEDEREQAILVDYFVDAPAVKVSDLVGQGFYERAPSQSRAAAAFATSPDRGDHYAARIRGDFRPPAAGSYRFTAEADDSVEVWLAPVDDPAARQKVVMSTYDRKRSDPVALDPARTYRLEALFVEYDLTDSCRIGWELPNGTAELPIPAARFLGPTPPRHGLKREVWRGIGEESVQVLIDSPAFKGPPTHVDWILGAKALCDGIEYGERLSGWIVPPATGDYRFMLENDDGAKFLISGDDQAAGLTSRFDRPYVADFNSSQTAPLHLEAGKRYRIEILHKQGGGDAFVGLGWIKPDGVREPIPRECVVPLP